MFSTFSGGCALAIGCVLTWWYGLVEGCALVRGYATPRWCSPKNVEKTPIARKQSTFGCVFQIGKQLISLVIDWTKT